MLNLMYCYYATHVNSVVVALNDIHKEIHLCINPCIDIYTCINIKTGKECITFYYAATNRIVNVCIFA